MARAFDELTSNQERARDVDRLLRKPEIIDPSAPSLIDLLDQIHREQNNNNYLRPGTPRPYDPSRYETQIPPSLNARMSPRYASMDKGDRLDIGGGGPPAPALASPQVSPEQLQALRAAGWSTENVLPSTGLPAAATAVPEGLPGVRAMPRGLVLDPAPTAAPEAPKDLVLDPRPPVPTEQVAPKWEIPVPLPPQRPVAGPQVDNTGAGITRDLSGVASDLSLLMPQGPQGPPPQVPPAAAPTPAVVPVQTTTFTRPPVAPDATGVAPAVTEAPAAPVPLPPSRPAEALVFPQISKALSAQIDSISGVTKRLGRSPMEDLPQAVVEEGLRTPGTAASLARWARAYEEVVNAGSLRSLVNLRSATRNLNNNLNTNVDVEEVIKGLRDNRAAQTSPSPGLDLAAARFAKLMQLQQGVSDTVQNRVTELVKTPRDLLEGKYPYTAGMTAADYTDRPGADTPQMQLTGPAFRTAFEGWRPPMFPRTLPARPVTSVPQVPPSAGEGLLAATQGRRAAGQYARAANEQAAGGWFRDANGQWVQAAPASPLVTPPPSLGELLSASGQRAAGEGRRSAGHYKSMVEQRLRAGWKLGPNGEWIAPGG